MSIFQGDVKLFSEAHLVGWRESQPRSKIHVLPATPFVNPFRTAVPFWGQTTRNLTGLSPKTGLRFLKGQGVYVIS